MLRNSILFVALLSLGMPASAGTPREIAGKPAAKLVGTWHSAQETITFKPNGLVVYKGHSHYFAAGNGVIQIKSKHVIRNLPYRMFDGKLTVTDNGVDTVYTRE
ncbi:MAG TPA: hypothetical protein VFW59_07240 [Gallionella sp.]|nr:hypothetical protein [Gallionella sp.]